MIEATLGNTIGAAFLGIIGSAILFGASASQFFVYFTHFKNDWKIQKFFVGWLMFVNVVHLAFAIHSVYFYLITNFGRIGALNDVVWTFKMQTLLNFVTVMSVQGLYAWRVRSVGKHFARILPWMVVGFVGVGWVFGIMLMVNIWQTKSWDRVAEFQWLLFTAFIFATLIDFVIATTLCYYLTRNRSIFTETNNRILRVMHYVVACGFLTSACSLGAFLTLATMPKTLIFIGVDFLLPRMYMLSYMTMLNARRVITEKDPTSFNVTGALNQFRLGKNSSWTDQTGGKPTTMETQTSAQDTIPLATSKHGEKASQQTTLESNIGV